MPKISQINFQVFKLYLNQPLVTSHHRLSDRTGVIIQVLDAEGKFGLGEASPLVSLGMEPLMDTARALKKVRKLLVGQELASIAEVSDLINSWNLPPAARHGIELALLNWLAAQQEVKLAQLIHGNHHRFAIAVNGLIGQVPPPQAITKAGSLWQQGYSCVKVKVGDSQDLERVQAIRQHYPNLKIRLDANQAWSVTEAIAKLRMLEKWNIEYVEEPVGIIAELAIVKNHTEIAIAADETIRNISDLEALISQKAAQIVILKPMVWGGILPALGAAHLAIQSGLEVVITHSLDGAIARLGALHLAALPEIKRHCGLDANHLFKTHDQLTKQTLAHQGTIQI